MIRGWFRSRAALAAEREEARVAFAECDQLRVQLHFAEADVARLTKQRAYLARELDGVKRTLLREREERSAIADWTPAEVLSVSALLRERARADALAERLDVLQAANMAADQH